jgi:hypothetical protein
MKPTISAKAAAEAKPAVFGVMQSRLLSHENYLCIVRVPLPENTDERRPIREAAIQDLRHNQR